jgi:RNA polymerase sigma factor (sigma-70 family)
MSRMDTDTEPESALLPEEPQFTASAMEDARLVRECLDGSEQAWGMLVDKYKRLIYSIPLKYGASRDDAADIFQAVCLEMFSELHKLRKLESLRSWIMTVTAHKAFHWKRQQRPQDLELDGMEREQAEESLPPAPALLQEAEREHLVREAIAAIPPRCAEMIRLLFYEDPPLPYADVARRLGLATGSIGFIRGRCLKRLQKELGNRGF